MNPRSGRPNIPTATAPKINNGSAVLVNDNNRSPSILVQILTVFGVLKLITPVIGGILKVFGIDPCLAASIFNGILEIDLGTVAASRSGAPLVDKIMIAGWIIAWSGLSVHGQVASVIHDTDIRMGPYIVARFLHGIFAAGYTWFLMKPLATVFAPLNYTATSIKNFNQVNRFIFSGRQLLIGFGILLLCSLIAYFARRYALVNIKRSKVSCE